MAKYVRIDSRGNFKYRRRVPEQLQSTLGKKEFVKLLGKTEAEAMRNYGPYHAHIEELLAFTKPAPDHADLLKIKASIEAQFADVQADPFSPGRSEGERMAREEEIARILQTYPINSETGYPDPESLSLKDTAKVTALQSGTYAIVAEPTVRNAFDLYLAEKNEPDPKKRKSQYPAELNRPHSVHGFY